MSTILDLSKNVGFPTAHLNRNTGFKTHWILGGTNMYRSTRVTCFRKQLNGLFSRTLKVALVMNGGVARISHKRFG